MLSSKLMCLKQEKWASIRIWVSLTRAKLGWLDAWVRASPKLQLLCGVPSLQWSVSIESGPRKEHWWTSDRVMGGQGLLMLVGSEVWPVWSDPTDELLLLKLLKKLMLVLIEWCQNTQCIAVCCVWGCIAADQSGCPVHRWKHQTWARECQNWTTQSNGRRWPGLTNHILFYITWMVKCMCVANLGNTCHQDALWE